MKNNELVYQTLELMAYPVAMAELLHDGAHAELKTFYFNRRLRDLTALDVQLGDEQVCAFLDEALLPQAKRCVEVACDAGASAELTGCMLFGGPYDLSVSIGENGTVTILFFESRVTGQGIGPAPEAIGDTVLTEGFDGLPIGIAYVDKDGKFVKMNRRFAHLLSIKKMAGVKGLDDLPALKKAAGFGKIASRLENERKYEVELSRRIGTKRAWLKLEARKGAVRKGAVPFYVLMLSDITLYKRNDYQHQLLFHAHEQLRLLSHIFSRSRSGENIVSKTINTMMLNGIYDGILFYMHEKEMRKLQPLASSDRGIRPSEKFPPVDLNEKGCPLAESFMQSQSRSFIEEEIRNAACFKPFLPWLGESGGMLHTVCVRNKGETVGLLAVVVDTGKVRVFTGHFIDELEHIGSMLGHEAALVKR